MPTPKEVFPPSWTSNDLLDLPVFPRIPPSCFGNPPPTLSDVLDEVRQLREELRSLRNEARKPPMDLEQVYRRLTALWDAQHRKV